MRKRQTFEIIAMGWPIAVEMVLLGLLSNANQYLWNSFSEDAVATIGSCNQIFSLAANSYGIISVGGSILLASAFGAKKTREISQLIISLVTLTFAAGIFLGVLGVGIIPVCIQVLHIPEELLEMTRQYLLVVLGISVCQGMLTTLTAVFRSMGRMKLIMVVNVVVNLLAVLFNGYILYFVPHERQTITMYAMNNIYAQLIGSMALLWILKKEGHFGPQISIHIVMESCKNQMKRILSFGIPAGMEGIFYLIGQIIIVGFVGMLGKEAMVVRAYVLTVTTYMSVILNVMTTASYPLVGNLVGRGEEAEVISTSRRVIWYSFVGTVVCCGIFWLLSGAFLRLYTQDEALLQMASKLVAVHVVYNLLLSLAGPWFAIMKAVGDVKFVFGVSILGIIFNVIVSYVFGILAGWGLVGIWIGFMTDFIIKISFSMVRFKRGYWKKGLLKM